MATIYRGLNVNFYLNDIINDREALLNLGLNPDDLEVVSGIGRGDNSIEKNEFKTISGLNLDAQKELFSIARSGQNIEQLLTSSNKVDFINRVFDLNMEFGADVDDQLRAGAIKYKFYDYASDTLRTADISTSRISSWSSIGDGVVTNDTPIIYGSQVEILGGAIKITDLGTTTAPAEKRYPAELPTDTLTLNINGTNRDFYVMRDIPIVAYGTFRNATFNHTVDQLAITNGNGDQIRPVWRIENLNDPSDFRHTFSAYTGANAQYLGQSSVGLSGSYTFRDQRARTLTRKIEFYYPPKEIKYIRLAGINMTDLPQASLPNVETLDFSFNALQTLPAFYGDLTPNLKSLNLRLNVFTTANQAGVNTTLSNFFAKSGGGAMDKLEYLNLQTTFSANENIDMSYLTSLRSLYWAAYYNRYNYRRMTGSVTPRVNSSTIVNYEFTNHGYSWLASNVNLADNLDYLNLNWTGISGCTTGGGSTTRTLTFPNARDTLSSIYLAGARTDVIDVSDFTDLVTYYHYYNYDFGGADRTIAGKFSGGIATGALAKLTNVSFYSSYITGQLNGEFSNKPALSYLDLRYTSLGPGGLTTNEFSGSGSLANVYIAGGSFSTDNFFGNSQASTGYNYSNGDSTISDSQVFTPTNMFRFYAYDNRGIGGFLPDLSGARNLYYLLLRNTNLTGEIPNFSLNTRLQYIRFEGARFTGQIPSINNSSIRYIRLENNNFELSLPEQNLRNCYLFYAHGNSISGSIPSWANCSNMQYLKLNNNSLTGYIPTAISSLRNLRNFDVSNNNLSKAAIENIIADLMANYAARARRGVNVNMLGNGISESDLSTEALANLNTVRSYGWSVLL
jgi:Leucine-rich repeat (LRR) protein